MSMKPQADRKNRPSPNGSLGLAVYPGKEAWKSEPGHRYTAEELKEMDRNWQIRVVNPDRPRVVSAD